MLQDITTFLLFAGFPAPAEAVCCFRTLQHSSSSPGCQRRLKPYGFHSRRRSLVIELRVYRCQTNARSNTNEPSHNRYRKAAPASTSGQIGGSTASTGSTFFTVANQLVPRAILIWANSLLEKRAS